MSHTPEVYQNGDQHWTGNFKFFIDGVMYNDTDSVGIRKEVFKYRPESIHSWKDQYGYRPALYWKHLGRVNTVTPIVDWGYEFHVNGAGLFEYRHRQGNGVESLRYRMEAFPDVLAKRAINGALSKLKEQRVNFGVAFGERRQTAKLATDTIRRIAQSASLFRGRYPREWANVKRLSASKRALPNSWLEYTYGWKPSVSDVTGAIQLLDEKNKERPLDVTVRKTISRTVTEKGTADGDSILLLGLQSTDWQLMLQFTTYHRATAVASYSLENELLHTAASLGITNPYDAAWELLPWSFVVDWAVPIGTYFNLQDADLGFSLRRASVGQRSTCIGACRGLTRVSNYFPHAAPYVSGLESIRYVMSEFERVPAFTGEFVPQLYFQNPFGLPEAAQNSRLISAISLLTQAFR